MVRVRRPARGRRRVGLSTDDARAQLAFLEACSHYQKALVFLKADGLHEQAARSLMKLGLAYNQAGEYEKSRLAYDDGFVIWKRLSNQIESQQLIPAPHPWRRYGGSLINLKMRDPTTKFFHAGLNHDLFSGLVQHSLDWNIVPDVAESWRPGHLDLR